MSTLDELLQQQEILQQKIDAARKHERRSKIKDLQALLEKYALTPEDVFPTLKPKTDVKKKLPAKYRDPETSNTWSGAGRAPSWIKDRNYSDFLIAPSETPSEPSN
jgi:DNA-binding protein H-NS